MAEKLNPLEDPRAWEKGACPLCRTAAGGKLLYCFPAGEVQRGSSLTATAQLRIVRCRECGLAYLTPRLTPRAAEALYSSAAYFAAGKAVGYDNYAEQEHSLRLTFRIFLRFLKRQGLTGGDLADIGCGPGLLLEEAKGLFRKRMGTELSREQAARAASVADGVICGGPEKLLIAGHRFDLVTAVNVLEHVYDAVGFVKTCSQLLKSSGAFVAAVPDMGAFWRRIMGRRWPSFKFPEHIAYYDGAALRTLAQRADLRLLRTFSYHHFFPFSLVLRRLGCVKGIAVRGAGQWPLFLPAVMRGGIFVAR